MRSASGVSTYLSDGLLRQSTVKIPNRAHSKPKFQIALHEEFDSVPSIYDICSVDLTILADVTARIIRHS